MRFMVTALPVIIVVGLVGNTLSFVVLVTPQMRKTSVYFYLTVLSISDSLVLILSAFKTWLRIVSGFELLHQSNASCKAIFFLLNLSYHTSAWIVVLVTVDRFVAVWLPLKSAVMCTVTRARVATCILITLMTIYNTHILFVYGLHVVNNSTHCCIHPDIADISTILVYLKLFTYCVIPFIAIFTFNVFIIFKLRKTPNILIRQTFASRKGIEATNHVTNANNPDNPDTNVTIHTFERPSEGILGKLQSVRARLTHNRDPSGHQVKLTQMLVAICIVWILLTLPYCLFSFVVTTLSTDPHVRSVQLKVKGVCFFFFYTNHSVNFFLYCLVGKRFRTRLKALFCTRNQLKGTQSLRTQKSNFIEMDKINHNLLRNQTSQKAINHIKNQHVQHIQKVG